MNLLDNLQKTPYKYGFFAALRQLECFYKNKARIGYALKPSGDAVRFGQEPSLQFARTTLASFRIKSPALPKLNVLFFGVFGVNGPLPLHLTEFVRGRIRHAKDDTFAAFADMFHHRLLSFFYRAWADKEPTAQLDRADSDRFSFYVGSLLGLADKTQRERDVMPDYTKLHFAAHLGSQTKHASGLQAILADYFQVPVQIQEFVGEWLDMPATSYCFLNDDPNTGQLGVSAVLGTKSWQCQHKFRIVMGPLHKQEYESFLPTGAKLAGLHSLVKNYVGFGYAWDLNLCLKKEQVPTTQLGRYGQLGWTSWLQACKREEDVNELYLNLGGME